MTDPMTVQIIGVFDPDQEKESFCYTVNAPTNLWIGGLVSDGTRMSPQFMAYILNKLIENDLFDLNNTVTVWNQNGAGLKATVGELVGIESVDAFQADDPMIKKVMVEATTSELEAADGSLSPNESSSGGRSVSDGEDEIEGE